MELLYLVGFYVDLPRLETSDLIEAARPALKVGESCNVSGFNRTFK